MSLLAIDVELCLAVYLAATAAVGAVVGLAWDLARGGLR